MKSFPLPIRMVGAGSQVEEEEMQYLDMPRDMRTFEMPRVPETGDTQALVAARDLLADILSRMNRWTPSSGNLRFDLRGVAPQALASAVDQSSEEPARDRS